MHKEYQSLKRKQDVDPLSSVTFTIDNKNAVIQKIQTKKRPLAPPFVFTLFSIIVLIGAFQFFASKQAIETITDSTTSSEIATVRLSEGLITAEWLSDAMDRGNHDYETIHSLLVIDPAVNTFKRGDVVYYQMPAYIRQQNPNIPAQYLGRIVALPGESVEIIDGQVWIDGKKLETFYGRATRFGLNAEEYLKKVDKNSFVNEEAIRETFSISASLTHVKENEVYILVDQWWRGTDSRYFGALKQTEIIGVVLGFEEK